MPYRNKRPSVSFFSFVLRATGVILAVLALFFILQKVVGKVPLPSLHSDDVRSALSSKRVLIAHIDELENTLAGMKALSDQQSLLQEENDALKAELGRGQAPHGTLARVLTMPSRSFYDTLLIDAGEAEGITEGQSVFAFDAVAIGTISSVETHRATVQLFSAPGRETTGNAEGSDVAITLIGRGGGEYEVRMPRDLPFAIGESVSLQSVHMATLATIEKIITDPRDPFQRLLAKVPVNLNALKFVVVR
ncbi:hypothetical protein IT401_00935 [Candidatus Nomurabacteria bacterium]|nr:hypothetical protein [Candidatus Nomurabacteria bacterium]